VIVIVQYLPVQNGNLTARHFWDTMTHLVKMGPRANNNYSILLIILIQIFS